MGPAGADPAQSKKRETEAIAQTLLCYGLPSWTVTDSSTKRLRRRVLGVGCKRAASLQEEGEMRFRVVVGIGVLFAGALLLPSTAEAQGGTISGLVSDSTGGILSGVTVEATSPVMIERTLTAITDGSGRYTIVNLRPG